MKIEQANKLINKHEKEDLPELRSQLETIAVQLEKFYQFPESDYTNAFIRANDSLVNGGTILLNCKEYTYSDIINLNDNISLICLNGYATLKALNLQKSCIKFGSNSRIENIILRSETTVRDSLDTSSKLYCQNKTNVRIKNVVIDGANSAGMIFYNLTDFILENCIVSNTKADGIHLTDGCKNGIIQNNFIKNVGDDGIACVSYSKSNQVENIKILNNTVDCTNARGIANIGSKKIYILNNTINNTATASINVAFEISYDTHIPSETYVSNNICSNYNKTINGLGAISVMGAEGVVEISNNTILDTVEDSVLKLPLLFDCPKTILNVNGNIVNATCERYFNFLVNSKRYEYGVNFTNNKFTGGNCTKYSEVFKIDNFVFTNNVFNGLSDTLEKDISFTLLKNSIIENNNLFRLNGSKGKIYIEDLYESRVGCNGFLPIYKNTTEFNPYTSSYEWNNITSQDLGMVVPLLGSTPDASLRTAKIGALVVTGSYPNYYLQVRYGTNDYAKVKLTV